jgi:hypothetical protein
MVSDFWLGVMAASTAALGITVTLLATLIIWLAKRLSRFVNVSATQDKRGAVKFSAEVGT